jgi:hypothetical protein
MMKREIRGKEYTLVVLRITGWDEKGRPQTCVVGWDDTTFNLADENLSREFMTAWVPVVMAEPRRRH